MLAIEFGPHIRVNAIAPGLVLPSDSENGERFERLRHETLLQRGPDEADIVLAFEYLLAASAGGRAKPFTSMADNAWSQNGNTMTDKDYTRIFLDEVLVEVPVGFAAWERFPDKPTLLSVSVELLSDKAEWPDKRLENLIDYSRVYAYIMGWPSQPRRESLEALCEDLVGILLRRRSHQCLPGTIEKTSGGRKSNKFRGFGG